MTAVLCSFFFQFAVLGKYDFWLVEEYADGVGGGQGRAHFEDDMAPHI